MRLQVFLVGLVCGLAAAPLAAQETAEAVPDLVVKEAIKDLGTVPQGEVVGMDYELYNEGTGLLTIKAVRPTCGCTVAEFDKEIPPGGTGTVHAELDTTRYSGPLTKAIIVLSDDPDTPTTRLVIKANIQPYLEVLPRPLVRFNTIQGDEVREKIVVISGDGQPFEITDVSSTEPAIGAEIRPLPKDELVHGRSEHQVEVMVTVGPDVPSGPVNADLTLNTTHPKAKQLSLKVFGVVRQILNVTPSQIQFGSVKPSVKPGRNVIVVNNRKDTAVKVTDATVDDEAFEAEVYSIEEGKRYQVTVTVKPDAPLGAHSATLTITTDDAEFSELKVPVAANLTDQE